VRRDEKLRVKEYFTFHRHLLPDHTGEWGDAAGVDGFIEKRT